MRRSNSDSQSSKPNLESIKPDTFNLDLDEEFSFELDDEVDEVEDDSKSSSKQDSKKKKHKTKSVGKIGIPRIIGSVILAGASGLLFYGVSNNLYNMYVAYPPGVDVSGNNTGIDCLDEWVSSLQDLNPNMDDGYLKQEVDYANDDKGKVDFYKKMVSTISYTPYPVSSKNIYGEDLYDNEHNTVYMPSTVGIGEYVMMTCVDYDSIKIDLQKLDDLMSDYNLHIGDVDYSNLLVSVFVDYMNSLSLDELPTKIVSRVPFMERVGNGYSMSVKEDIYIDKLLFSSREFYNLLDRFSSAAGTVGVNSPEWEEWNSLSDEDKSKTPEPEKSISGLSVSQEWLDWSKLSVVERQRVAEPSYYPLKDTINKTWCGAYYLQNEYVSTDENGNIVSTQISADIGDGSFEDPAGLNTDVVTSIFVQELQEDGSFVENEYPIRVKLIDYGVSENAIAWFESKSTLNRGIDISSELQYAYFCFEVTNLSDKQLVIYDNSSLSDDKANVFSRTGTMYGLNDMVILDPDESGVIESWGRSTELNKCYLIWGADFARKTDPVWFRVLAGNIDDPTEEKGVTLNTSRGGSKETEEDTSNVLQSSIEDELESK